VQIIPVIDIYRGQVVFARGGDRSNYQPLQSPISPATSVELLVEDLLAWYPFKQIYIADLDAIETQQYRFEFYQQLSERFVEVTFMLDNGICSAQQWEQWQHSVPTAKHIVASESLTDIALLSHSAMSAGVLSLDFRHGQFLGQQEILTKPNLWPSQVIVMSLDAVGANKGPDLQAIQAIQQAKQGVSVIAAGGVRGEADIKSLEQQGVDAVLVASALHTGALTPEQIAAWMD
jgi:phosphoribosylformimino-5-aminoimidazole carboxamide ribotide isomerase